MKTLKIYNSSFEQVTQITDYEFFQWDRRYRQPDRWILKINRYKVGVDKLIEGNWIVVDVGGKTRSGRIEKSKLGLTQAGKISEDYVFEGLDSTQPVTNRIALEDTASGDGYDTQTAVAAETAIKHYVDGNIVNPTDTDREIPNFTIAADSTRGNTVDIRARFQKLNELLNSLCLSGDIGYEATFDGSGNIFDVVEGLDRTEGNGVNDPVVISTSTGNIQSIQFENSILDVLNLAYVGGQGVAAARTVREVFKTTEPIGYDRKEVFIDARDLSSNDELDNRGLAVINDNIDKLLMAFTYLSRGMFQYLTDFDLGDIITITYEGVATLDARIISVKESYLPDQGQVIDLGIGKEFPDIYRLIKDDIKNLQPEQRR